MKTSCYVLFGPPGAGKGTQSSRVAQAIGASHLSSGELLRAAVEEESELGQQIAPILQQGQLVPTDLLLPLIEEGVSATPEEQAILLDGFPRNRSQAQLLDETLARHDRAIGSAFLLEVPRDEIFHRLLKRGRADDRPEVIENRLEIYESETRPLRNYYEERGLLQVIDGTGTPEDVTERILATIDR